MIKVHARWLPKQLTEDQKTSRMTIVKEYLGHFNHDENKFLNCIVTGYEMWDHYAEPETKTVKAVETSCFPYSQEVQAVSILWQGYAGCFLGFM